MTVTVQDTDNIKVAFHHQVLTKCIGEPNHQYLFTLQNQIIRNRSTVESMLGGGQNS